jgi:predicted transcriptional regulator
MAKLVDTPMPTNAELDVLRVLWDQGESTVREVHVAIVELRGVGYTTVLKQMQVMHQKGLLTRQERFKSHVYAPAHRRTATQRALVRHLLDQAFSGSPQGLFQSALEARRLSAEEIDGLCALLEEARKRLRS